MTPEEIIAKLEVDEGEEPKEQHWLIKELSEHGFEEVELAFEGAWGDANIYEIQMFPVSTTIPESIIAKLKEWAFEALDKTNVNWWSDSGGFGTLWLNVLENKYSYEIHKRWEESELAAQGEEVL